MNPGQNTRLQRRYKCSTTNVAPSPAPTEDLLMAVLGSCRVALLAGSAFAASAPVWAQTAPPPPAATPTANKRVYVPADFARFAPKTAFDMLAQVPGFTIRSADQERGLGQASENVLINGQRI